VEELYRSHEFGEARARIGSILADFDSAIEVKFQAQRHFRGIDYSDTLFSGESERNFYRVFLDHAIALRRLTKFGPRHLKFYSIISKRPQSWGSLPSKTQFFLWHNRSIFKGVETQWQRSISISGALF
jgi:hypothetical protein